MKIPLVGQPNSGKSTLFNAVAGFRSLTSNFAGTTVEYTRGQARVDGELLDLIDLPGIYSLAACTAVEKVTRDFLLNDDWDVIVNVVDASQLARSLELTLELLDLESPLVICLNMMDEASRKGMTIDAHELQMALGVPVVEAIGSRGRGIIETFRAAREYAARGGRARPFVYAPEAERLLAELAEKIAAHTNAQPQGALKTALAPVEDTEWNTQSGVEPVFTPPLRVHSCGGGHLCAGCSMGTPAVKAGHDAPLRSWAVVSPAVAADHEQHRYAESALAGLAVLPGQSSITLPASAARNFPRDRFQAMQWVQCDPLQIRGERPEIAEDVEWAQKSISAHSGLPADAAISAARHAACLSVFERVTRLARPSVDWREKIDRVAMHPVWGYVLLLTVFLGFFQLIFNVGKPAEDRILNLFDGVVAALARHMNPHAAVFAGVKGAVLGTAGALAMVLPYLLPFLAGLAILEDFGYLARAGYLMDAVMHRLGLHGTATLPILVGYGCSVPAVMATRLLTTRRDRFIAAFLAVLVPCSARMSVIFALVGFYLSANYALGIYALNLLVVAATGNLLARLWPEVSPGMLMEVPSYRLPAARVVALKTWWRLREFVLVAAPMLVAGSVVLSLVDYYGWSHGINVGLSPLTAMLGLPRSVGLTLIFGVLRKELSLMMLMQALGTTHVLGVMTDAQILIFTLFVTFYLPCMATLAAMMREVGWRLTLGASSALLVLAVVVCLGARGVLALV